MTVQYRNFRPILDQIGKLWDRVDMAPVVRWGTVTQSSPLLVRLDGDTTTVSPQSLVTPIPVGRRVVCVEQHRRVTVVSALQAGDTGWVNLTPGVGVTLLGGQARMRNGVLTFRGRATKTDGSAFAAGSLSVLATLPSALATALDGYDTTVLAAGPAPGATTFAVAKMYIQSGNQVTAIVQGTAMSYIAFGALNGTSVD